MEKIKKLEDHISVDHIHDGYHNYQLPELTAYVDGVEPIVLIGLDVSKLGNKVDLTVTYIASDNRYHITDRIDNIFMCKLDTKAARILYGTKY